MTERRGEPLTKALAGLLVAGSALLIGASVMHPVLPLTGPGDLALIAATAHWRTIHITLLYATGMIIAGIWARWYVAEEGERPGLAIGCAVLAIGQALNAVNIAYMTGAGTEFARLAQGGADVAAVYEASHRFAVNTGRAGGFLVAIAALIVALTTQRQADEPRGLVLLAWLACVGGLAGNLLAQPGHPLMLTSIGLMALWQLGTGVRIVR